MHAEFVSFQPCCGIGCSVVILMCPSALCLSPDRHRSSGITDRMEVQTLLALTCQHLQQHRTDRGTSGEVGTSKKAGTSGQILGSADNKNHQLSANAALQLLCAACSTRCTSGQRLAPGSLSRAQNLPGERDPGGWTREQARDGCVRTSRGAIKQPGIKTKQPLDDEAV